MRISTAAYLAITVHFVRKTIRKIASPVRKQDKARMMAEALAQSIIKVIRGKYDGTLNVRLAKPLSQAALDGPTPVIEIYGTISRPVDRVNIKTQVETTNS